MWSASRRKGYDVLRQNEHGAEEVARGRVAPFGRGGKHRHEGVDGRVALGAMGGDKAVYPVARCRGEVLVTHHGKAVDGLHEVERRYGVGECAVRGDGGKRSEQWGVRIGGEHRVNDGFGAESVENPLLGGVEPMGDFVV